MEAAAHPLITATLTSLQERAPLNVLVVDDDPFFRKVLESLLNDADDTYPQLEITVTLTASGDQAIIACQESGPFDLVILDYCMPGFDGAHVLPALRRALGNAAAIVMISADAASLPKLQQSLECGADAFRTKPLKAAVVAELLAYTLDKRGIIARAQKRKRAQAGARSHDDDEGLPLARRPSQDALARAAPSCDSSSSSSTSSTHSSFKFATGAEGCVLARGRRGPCYLGLSGYGARSDTGHGHPIAMKHVLQDRGMPPPPHPHVNRVVERVVEGGQTFEMRVLCDGGELFDNLFATYADSESGTAPEDVALNLFAQIAAAVAHSHAHDAVHGQLHPENVLLAKSAEAGGSMHVQVTGFARAHEDAPRDGEGSPTIGLRPVHALDAPELRGRSAASAAELKPCDCLLYTSPSPRDS